MMKRGELAVEVEVRKSGLESREKDTEVGRELEKFPADVGSEARPVVRLAAGGGG